VTLSTHLDAYASMEASRSNPAVRASIAVLDALEKEAKGVKYVANDPLKLRWDRVKRWQHIRVASLVSFKRDW